VASQLTDYLRFVLRFCLKPKVLGAIAPSSRYLVAELTRDVGIETARSLAELGPGTGVVTQRIIDKKTDQCSFVAVEKDEHWVRLLDKRYADLDLVHGDAAQLDEYALEKGLKPFDAVICGLPFTVFGEDLQRSILDSISKSIAADGFFTTFAYVHGREMPAGKRFHRLLETYFDQVEVSRVIWRNTPPAVVYRACSVKGSA
jgi:phosphatidylethanolamine/phosphatidyl-N-methylethanolamine N-methyltransferase